jgi:hypothetical protein
VTNLLGPNIVGDQQAQTWSIGVCWRALETWLTYGELRDLHQLYCLKSSHLNASSYSNVPPCGNMYLTLLHWKLLAPLHVLVFISSMCLYMLCFLLVYLVYSSSCIIVCTPCTCVLWGALLYLVYILVGSFEWLMDYPILGEWYALAFHNPKNVCTWGIPPSIDIARLASLYMVCHSHEEFKIHNIH